MPKQIVFVDDSKSVLKTIEILLKNRVQNKEITIRTFSKTADFLDELESNSLEFDLLFLDINMPVMSGYDVLKKLRQIDKYKEIPVVALTTENTQEALQNGKEAGFDDWIIKINALTTLQKSINMTIDKYCPSKLSEDSSADAGLDTNSMMEQMREMSATIERLNAKLLIAEEDKTRFLSLIHNEFNNPLMTITMLMRDIIEDKEKTKEEMRESINMIFVDILTLNSQLSNILAGAEIESTTGVSKYLSNFSMKDMIHDILDTQQFIYQDKSIAVESSLSFDEFIYYDRDKCFLIFQNLIENAFDFSLQESKVVIKGYMENKNLIFTVSNLGHQIEEQSRMYDAFYRERSDFSRVHHGLGLGLAIVKHLVTFLGGAVSYSVDEGYNTFKISLPIEPDENKETSGDTSSFVFEDEEGSRF
ncbi:hybrid sensor histidine kinase/response regulator [bacterium]|nr:hybrid sensor histidine kinase/response regulator [bacterium]MBU1882876.1 hybrid sensor histidine kinase/response regulator [bacterium]